MNRMRAASLITVLAALALGLLLVRGGSASTPRPYLVVGTMQNLCYNDFQQIAPPAAGQPFAGQDAQYPHPAAHFSANADGTVTDLNTGLLWARDPGPKVTVAAAEAGAATYRLGGYTDWRLPTIKELYSLIDFRGVDIGPQGAPNARPFLDTTYFVFHYGDPARGERPIDAQYISATPYVGTTMGGNPTQFGVNFADGRLKGYPRVFPGGRPSYYYALYVRGNPAYGRNDFVDNGDETVTDRATGVRWLKNDSGGFRVGDRADGRLNWQQALAWAEGLTFAGHDDWRLPTAKELQSLVDYGRAPAVTHSPAISPLFNCTPITAENGQPDWGFYWSSTTHQNCVAPGAEACYVAFGTAFGYFRGAWIDVHGAGAQRSDPKAGNPANYPYGRGPQGDAVRIYNLVRCVRTQ